MKLYCTEIKPHGVKFQMGLRCYQEVLWGKIQYVKKVSKSAPTFSFGPEIPKQEPGILYMTAGENCNIEVALEEPQKFGGMIKNFGFACGSTYPGPLYDSA